MKHTCVVNLPKAEDSVTLGKEVRSLFIARPGNVLVGYDAQAIENRVEAHYVFKYPGGPEYAQEILSGDPHKKNAFFAFYPEELAALKLDYGTTDKDDPAFKPFRSKSKNGKYALSYGASPAKLAKTLGLPEYKGESIYERFWEANLPLALFREKLTQYWETTGGKKRLKGIDGRWLMTRSKHSLVNTAFQSAGGAVMDYSLIFMDKWLGGLTVDSEGKPCYNYKGYTLYRVAYMHDEALWDVPPAIADEIALMGPKSIEAAGRYLKFRVPLGGEAKIGPSWASVH
jgi:DNA polymerase-1